MYNLLLAASTPKMDFISLVGIKSSGYTKTFTYVFQYVLTEIWLHLREKSFSKSISYIYKLYNLAIKIIIDTSLGQLVYVFLFE